MNEYETIARQLRATGRRLAWPEIVALMILFLVVGFCAGMTV